MIDVVFPDGNEQEFIAMAKKLGYKGICFVYEKPLVKFESDFPIFSGAVCKNKLKNADFVFLNSNDRQLIRKKPTAVFGIEGTRDFIHQRDSGLDHVICKEMHKYNVGYMISFSAVLNSSERERFFGRVMQNIMLCNKYHVKIMIASFAKQPNEMRNPDDLVSFCRTLRAQKPLVLNTNMK
jgi:hypothetical protein